MGRTHLMSKNSDINGGASRHAHFIATLALIAGFWIASDVGYFFLLPWLGLKANYNDGPIAVTLYYVFWVGIAVIAFWPQYASWSRYAKWTTFENRLTSAIVWTLAFLGGVLFAAYMLPSLPPFNWRETWDPPELPRASSWYFLPKSIEILFQQLLVVALVLTLAAEKYSLRKISAYCAVLFGGTHILLVLGGAPWGYIIRFTVLAAVFGFVFPYLILRVRNGLAYSYVTHWTYYAVTVLLARIVGSGAALKFLKQMVSGS